MAATAATAPPLAAAEPAGRSAARAGALRQRILSALVLAPVALVAVALGGWALAALVAVAGALMGWEWARLCGGRTGIGAGGLALIVAVPGATVASAAGMPGSGLLLLVLAAGVALGLGGVLLAAGVLWIGLPCLGLVWLDAIGGRGLVLWLLAVVWATDIGAYAAGRSIGGPRLAPRFSPNKTWSGLLGGVVSAGLAGGAVAAALGAPQVAAIAALSAALAVVAQAGDLLESMAKRHFGVKDSSGLIPGHGGILDRLDGMLTVVPAVALISLAGGEGMLQWR